MNAAYGAGAALANEIAASAHNLALCPVAEHGLSRRITRRHALPVYFHASKNERKLAIAITLDALGDTV
ncbi:hypothetical protein LJR289_004790 [Pseudoduganella sp. LjRoot289]|uniref:hypothetical protein n=1 Tax=Pseudoduganella sp. LjRoot289 TaxID=3342314 RepID=UPI003ED00E6E